MALVLLLLVASFGAARALFNVVALEYTRHGSTYTLAALSLVAVLPGVAAAARLVRLRPQRLPGLPALLTATAVMLVGYVVLRDGFSYGFTAQGCFTNLESWLGVTRENSLVRWAEQVVGAILFFGAPAVGFHVGLSRPRRLAA